MMTRQGLSGLYPLCHSLYCPLATAREMHSEPCYLVEHVLSESMIYLAALTSVTKNFPA